MVWRRACTKRVATLAVLALVAFSFNAAAAPSVGSVSGTVQDGSSITIAGSGFGAGWQLE